MIELLLLAAGLPLPVIDYAKAIVVRPINGNVVLCSSPDGLPLARLAQQSVDRGGADFGRDQLMKSGGCMITFNTDPMKADFQEDVVWTGALRPPTMLHGTLRVVRVRFATPLDDVPMQARYYAAAEDLRSQ